MGYAIGLFLVLALFGALLEKKSRTKSKITIVLVKNQLVFLILAALLTIVHWFMADKIAPSGPITFVLILFAIANMYLARQNRAFMKNWLLIILTIISAIFHVATLSN